VSGDSADQVDAIQNDAGCPVVHDRVTVHIAAFAVGRRRGQAFDDRNREWLHSLLPAGRERSSSGVLLSEAGRQGLDGVIAAKKDVVFGAEVAAVCIFEMPALIVVLFVMGAMAFMFTVIFVIVVKTREGMRHGGKGRKASEKQSSVHEI
jgi:hypothetical protein